MANALTKEWHDALNCATENPLPGTMLASYLARLTAAGNALAADYEKAVERADREAAGRVRVHLALAQHGGEAASRINDDQP